MISMTFLFPPPPSQDPQGRHLLNLREAQAPRLVGGEPDPAAGSERRAGR